MILCILLLSFCSLNLATDITRPRGIPLNSVPLYDPTKPFRCLGNSKVVIPFSKVNDDYCDCHDGSDEPGTAACSNGVFHCVNHGYIASNLKSIYVGDGVCDCCDGSDEWSSGVECSNTCAEMGRAAVEEHLRKTEVQRQGYEAKLRLIEQGKEKKKQWEAQVVELEKQILEAEKLKDEKELAKTAAEEPETAALDRFKAAEAEKKAEEAAMRAKEEEERMQEQEDAKQEEEQKVEPEEEKEAPIEEAAIDPANIPEEAPQRVVFPGYRAEDEAESSSQEDEREEVEDFEESETDEETEDYAPTADEESSSPYDEQTQALVDAANEARQQLREAETALRSHKNELEKLQSELAFDFGSEGEFRALKGQCFELDEAEYVYKLCLFDKSHQIPKNGHSTSLGHWGEWVESADGPMMKYTNGMGCWNGPNRSTQVKLECGAETQLVSATEPNRCEYHFVLKTPLVCSQPQNVQHEHTEL